jgi:hypothetical protein
VPGQIGDGFVYLGPALLSRENAKGSDIFWASSRTFWNHSSSMMASREASAVREIVSTFISPCPHGRCA